MKTTIKTNVPEGEQVDNFQNATMSNVNDALVCSIAVTPKYPASVKSEADAEAYLKGVFAKLDADGWRVDVRIGEAEA
jgi:hypothetical protein